MSIFKFSKKEGESTEEAEKKATPASSTKKSSTQDKTATDKDKKSMKDLYENKETSKSASTKKTSGTKKESENKNIKRSANNSNAYKVLIRPLITEKASIMGNLNKYSFEVSVSSNKIEIAKAIEDVYKITPTSVNVIKMKGKKVIKGKYRGRRKDWKKAMVTLPKGESIQIYEGI